MRTSHPRPSDGFTLMELMVAVFLLAIGILGVSQIFAVSSRHTSFAREETVASTLALEIREKMLSETFEDLVSIFDGVDTSNPGSVTDPAAQWAEHVTDRLGETGRGTIRVMTPEEDESLLHGMVGVVVTLSWYEGKSEISLPLRFAVAKIGA